jgi:hypothetical protein
MLPNHRPILFILVGFIWQHLFEGPARPFSSTDKSEAQKKAEKLKLFGMFDKPLINDIGQGLLGNCYLLATLGSFAYKKPELIKKMI